MKPIKNFQVRLATTDDGPSYLLLGEEPFVIPDGAAVLLAMRIMLRRKCMTSALAVMPLFATC